MMTVHGGQIEWPDLERYSDAPVFNTKAVVQQTRIPAPTLRAWERRYTLLSPERANNTYRLYSERDIVMIRWLKDRVDSGMSISQAIALFRHLAQEQQHIQELLHKESGSSEFQIALPPVASSGTETSQDSKTEQPSKRPEALQPAHYYWSHSGPSQNQTSYPAIHNMHAVQERLLEAFKVLDEPVANLLLSSMLAIYPVEQVCSDLIVPTMWCIGSLWEQGKITVSVEHFASNFFRGLLTNLLHVTPVSVTGPLVIICCAPGEPHELAPLMLSLFLRRSNVRVAYLGQSIETAGLLQTIQQLTPVMVCLSVTMPAYLAALIDLGHKIEEIPSPRPSFVFGGQTFVQNKHLASHVPGIHLDGNLQSITARLQSILAEQQVKQN